MVGETPAEGELVPLTTEDVSGRRTLVVLRREHGGCPHLYTCCPGGGGEKQDGGDVA